MMAYLTPVTVKKRVYTVENYKDFTASVSGLKITDGGVSAGYGFVIGNITAGTDVIKVYCVRDRFFGYYADGYIYELTESGKVSLFEIGAAVPCVTEIIHDGQKKILFIGEKSCIVGSEVVETAWTTANVVAEHKGRIFSADGRIITFSEPFDFSSRTTGISVSGTIRVSERAGEVTGFLSESDKLYVICRAAVYELITDNDSIDFKLKRLCYLEPEITPLTVAEYAGGLACVRGRGLYTFSGGKFTKVSDYVQRVNYTVTGNATIADGIYYLPVKVGTSAQVSIYAFDFNTRSESIFSAVLPIVEKGYTLISGKLSKITGGTIVSGTKSLTAKEIDFDLPSEKTLCSICVTVGAVCTLSVKGSFGTKKLTLKKGYNEIKTNLKSPSFTLQFSLTSNGFYIKDLRLIYRKKGE